MIHVLSPFSYQHVKNITFNLCSGKSTMYRTNKPFKSKKDVHMRKHLRIVEKKQPEVPTKKIEVVPAVPHQLCLSVLQPQLPIIALLVYEWKSCNKTSSVCRWMVSLGKYWMTLFGWKPDVSAKTLFKKDSVQIVSWIPKDMSKFLKIIFLINFFS